MRKIGKEQSIFDYGRNFAPCLRIPSGETVLFETGHRFSDLEDLERALGQKERSSLFAVTGPLYVDGATPGKILKVEILDVRLTSRVGYCVLLPNRGAFGSQIKQNHIRQLTIGKHGVRFGKEVSLPLSPMVGRIGVAPRRGSRPSHLPGPHGGNLDCKDIGPGATVYLPIFVEGALLAIGDIHAAMGDGECGLSGVEAEGKVWARCSVVHDFPFHEPWVVTEKRVMALASAASMGLAARKALSYLGEALQRRLNMTFEESVMLMSAAADVGVCQMVNPLMTAKASISRDILSFP